MQQLLGELAKHKYIELYRCEDGSMTVTDLFWVHPVSLDLLRTFSRVLVMDCTYKTNRYRLPLLEIVLQILRDLIDNSVLPKVIVTDRELALMNAIDNTFPNARHLLCRWHINKNVLMKCKKMFETKEKWDKFNTHIQVKASFEKSLTTVQRQFKPSQFRELWGNMSICALEYVLAKNYMRQGRLIPFNSIDVHWTRLTICVHNPKVEKLELTCIPELEMILKRFNESDIAMQLDMLKKLTKIANPANTFLIEPDSTLASHQSKKKRASKVRDKKQNVKTKTYCTRTSLPSAYAGDFPSMLIPFTKLMNDIDGDENCDFRTIAGLLGLGENNWVQSCTTCRCNSLTFLPLRSPPVTLTDRREIAIGFVNGNHFVQPGHPVPPIAVLWRVHH
ncbi:uncharacterized protein LOC114271253 [Camellia sinensis]|uniref:uncharacterized protein LOC114271253 n=1 Tax=Camellia sinensis TaxID=4442 RepID=UPI00103648B1|nr:uncharacterized protein LOC114271253 [Camellia sinensis]